MKDLDETLPMTKDVSIGNRGVYGHLCQHFPSYSPYYSPYDVTYDVIGNPHYSASHLGVMS